MKIQPFIYDQQLLAPSRAASDLRRGLPVIITGKSGSILMVAAEFITNDSLKKIRLFEPLGIWIGLTYERANILKISPRSGSVALVSVTDQMDVALLQNMADPVDDLMFPLRGPFKVSDVGADQRHEAGIKLCKIAEILPAAIFIQLDDEGLDLMKGDLLSVKDEDIFAFDLKESRALEIVTSAKVPLEGATKTTMVAFRPKEGGTEHFAIIIGDPSRSKPLLTRIHSECFTGDLLGSLKCDCGDQMRGAIKFMEQSGGGILLYLAQEGRGIGLINKLRAYQLQDQGFDTVDANERLGFMSDERIFEPAAQMLKLLGFKTVDLLTNNPNKVAGLEACDIKVNRRVEHKFPENIHNSHYLKTKKNRSGHLL